MANKYEIYCVVVSDNMAYFLSLNILLIYSYPGIPELKDRVGKEFVCALLPFKLRSSLQI